MGQPLKGLRYGGLSVGTFGSDYNFAGYGSIGIYKDIVNPALSEVAFSLEGYLGGRTQELDGGFRALLGSRVLRIGGGLVGRGSGFRIDWLQSRGHSFS